MDYVIDEFFEMRPAPEPEYLEVPEGEHEFKIHKVTSSSEKTIVTLAHADKRYGLVWFKPPAGKKWAARLVGELATALGMDAAAWKAADPDDLKGRRVIARIYHTAGDRGTFTNVGNFKAAPPRPAEPAEPVEAPKPVAKRTPTQKADAASPGIPSDDIPF
jgi:hypothetical protein